MDGSYDLTTLVQNARVAKFADIMKIAVMFYKTWRYNTSMIKTTFKDSKK